MHSVNFLLTYLLSSLCPADDASVACVLQHNLCCDNCHSHVAYALNLMKYRGCSSWNMITLCFLMLIHGKYVRYDHSCVCNGLTEVNEPVLLLGHIAALCT